MAEVLDNHNFSKRGRRAIYPYDDWFDGRIWKLELFVDFDCKPRSIRQALYNAAAKRNLALSTTVGDDHVIIQAKTKTETTGADNMDTKDWSEITHLEIEEGESPLGTDCWITADGMAHYDLNSAEERRNQLVWKFQGKDDSGTI